MTTKKFHIFIFIAIVFNNNAFCSHHSCKKDTILMNKLKLLKQYADNYHPISLSEDIAILPIPDTLTANAIEYIWKMDSAKVEKFVLLITLKLYKSHIMCCRQSYDIRSDDGSNTIMNPIFNYFMKSIGLGNFRPGNLEDYVNYGPITSSLAYAYVNRNRRLLKDKSIRDEYKEIEAILKGLKLFDEN